MSATTNRPGTVGRPLGLAPLHVPRRIALDATGERLVWDDSRDDDASRVRLPDPAMLDQLMLLAHAPKEQLGKQVLKFAQRFGPLRLCERHRLPVSHNHRRFLDDPGLLPCHEAMLPPHEAAAIVERSGKGVAKDGWCQESVADWQRFARQVDAMMNIAGELRYRRPGDRAQWAVLAGLGHKPGAEPLSGDIVAQRSSLAEVVNVWLQWGEIRTQLDWAQATARMTYALPERYNLFGTLALQLATSVSTTRGGPAQCASCHRTFIAARKPASGRNAYCPACGRQAANKEAKRRQRAKARRRSAAPSGSGDITARHPQ